MNYNISKIQLLKKNIIILQEFKKIDISKDEVMTIKFEDEEFKILKNPKSFEVEKNNEIKEQARKEFIGMKRVIQYHSNADDFTPIFEYNGLKISGIASTIIDGKSMNKPSIRFRISLAQNDEISWEPHTLHIPNDQAISLDSCLVKVSNFLKSIDNKIKLDQAEIEKYDMSLKMLEQKSNYSEYKNLEYLKALRADSKNIINELDKISKDEAYLTTFVCKSDEMKGSNEFAEIIAKFNQKRREFNEEKTINSNIEKVVIDELTSSNQSLETKYTMPIENSENIKINKSTSVKEILGEIDEFYLPKQKIMQEQTLDTQYDNETQQNNSTQRIQNG